MIGGTRSSSADLIMVRDGRDPLEHYPSKLMLTVLAGAATWEVGIARSSVYWSLKDNGSDSEPHRHGG